MIFYSSKSILTSDSCLFLLVGPLNLNLSKTGSDESSEFFFPWVNFFIFSFFSFLLKKILRLHFFFSFSSVFLFDFGVLTGVCFPNLGVLGVHRGFTSLHSDLSSVIFSIFST